MWRVGSQHPGPSGRVRLQPQQRQANDDLLALIGWRHGVPTALSMATNTEDQRVTTGEKGKHSNIRGRDGIGLAWSS